MKIYASKHQEWRNWEGYFYVDDVDKALSTVKRFTDLGFKSRYIYTNGIEVGYIIKFRNGEITYDYSDSDIHADWWTDSYIDFKFNEFDQMNICISKLTEYEINNLDNWLYKCRHLQNLIENGDFYANYMHIDSYLCGLIKSRHVLDDKLKQDNILPIGVNVVWHATEEDVVVLTKPYDLYGIIDTLMRTIVAGHTCVVNEDVYSIIEEIMNG